MKYKDANSGLNKGPMGLSCRDMIAKCTANGNVTYATNIRDTRKAYLANK